MSSIFGEIIVANGEDLTFKRERDTRGFLRYLAMVILHDIDDLRLLAFSKSLNDIDWFSEEELLSQHAEKYNSIFLVSDKLGGSSVELKFGEYTDGFMRIKESAMSRNPEILNRIRNSNREWGIYRVEYSDYRIF